MFGALWRPMLSGRRLAYWLTMKLLYLILKSVNTQRLDKHWRLEYRTNDWRWLNYSASSDQPVWPYVNRVRLWTAKDRTDSPLSWISEWNSILIFHTLHNYILNKTLIVGEPCFVVWFRVDHPASRLNFIMMNDLFYYNVSMYIIREIS